MVFILMSDIFVTCFVNMISMLGLFLLHFVPFFYYSPTFPLFSFYLHYCSSLSSLLSHSFPALFSFFCICVIPSCSHHASSATPPHLHLPSLPPLFPPTLFTISLLHPPLVSLALSLTLSRQLSSCVALFLFPYLFPDPLLPTSFTTTNTTSVPERRLIG